SRTTRLRPSGATVPVRMLLCLCLRPFLSDVKGRASDLPEYPADLHLSPGPGPLPALSHPPRTRTQPSQPSQPPSPHPAKSAVPRGLGSSQYRTRGKLPSSRGRPVGAAAGGKRAAGGKLAAGGERGRPVAGEVGSSPWARQFPVPNPRETAEPAG